MPGARPARPGTRERFDAVEVNSSFYAVPDAGTVERWVTATPDGFSFDVKLHRLLSRHAGQPDSLPPDLRDGLQTNERGRVLLTPELEAEVVDRTLEALEPLEQSGQARRASCSSSRPPSRPESTSSTSSSGLIERAAPRRAGGRVPPPGLGGGRAVRAHSRLPRRARRGVRGGGRPARAPRADHAADRRGDPRRPRLPARPRPQRRGLHEREDRGRAIRLGVRGRRARGDRRPRARARRGGRRGAHHVQQQPSADAPTAARRFRELVGQDPGPPPEGAQKKLL